MLSWTCVWLHCQCKLRYLERFLGFPINNRTHFHIFTFPDSGIYLTSSLMHAYQSAYHIVLNIHLVDKCSFYDSPILYRSLPLMHHVSDSTAVYVFFFFFAWLSPSLNCELQENRNATSFTTGYRVPNPLHTRCLKSICQVHERIKGYTENQPKRLKQGFLLTGQPMLISVLVILSASLWMVTMCYFMLHAFRYCPI